MHNYRLCCTELYAKIYILDLIQEQEKLQQRTGVMTTLLHWIKVRVSQIQP